MLATLFGRTVCIESSSVPQSALEDIGFVFNSDGLLSMNTIIHQDSVECSRQVHGLNNNQYCKRKVITLSDSLFDNFFKKPKSLHMSAVSCIDIGVEVALFMNHSTKVSILKQ